MMRKSSFPPIVAPNTRVLVLGSLPGEASLAAQRYYAHPRNGFWRLIGRAIGRELEPLDYEARLAALLEAGVGLWDTVASAHRRGSLDAAIREAQPNALVELVASLPDLRAVGFNGQAAARIGLAQLAPARLGPTPQESKPPALVPLPSSSPAYAAMPLREKEKLWARLGDFLR